MFRVDHISDTAALHYGPEKHCMRRRQEIQIQQQHPLVDETSPITRNHLINMLLETAIRRRNEKIVGRQSKVQQQKSM